MHRHYGMPLGTVGHAHDGDDGPTHGPHTHDRLGLGAVVTLEQLHERSERVVVALASLLLRVNGHLNQNPYTITEFKEALKALYCHTTGATDDVFKDELRFAYMDVDLKAIAGVTE